MRAKELVEDGAMKRITLYAKIITCFTCIFSPFIYSSLVSCFSLVSKANEGTICFNYFCVYCVLKSEHIVYLSKCHYFDYFTHYLSSVCISPAQWYWYVVLYCKLHFISYYRVTVFHPHTTIN